MEHWIAARTRAAHRNWTKEQWAESEILTARNTLERAVITSQMAIRSKDPIQILNAETRLKKKEERLQFLLDLKSQREKLKEKLEQEMIERRSVKPPHPLDEPFV